MSKRTPLRIVVHVNVVGGNNALQQAAHNVLKLSAPAQAPNHSAESLDPPLNAPQAAD